MDVDTYKTLEKESEGIFKDKGSKFIAKAFPVKKEEDIKEIVSRLKKDFYDARHHCYAYRIGFHGENFRHNDDGEPSSTAGKPILGQLLSNNITNALIVVIRYFGGTKLGVSGLIHAYKSASINAISNNNIIEKTINEHYEISFDYLVLNDVMKIIKDENPTIESQQFDLNCLIKLNIRRKNAELLENKLSKIEGIKLKNIGSE